MATKKKVLLEQETPVPENTAPADGTISSAGPPADARRRLTVTIECAAGLYGSDQ